MNIYLFNFVIKNIIINDICQSIYLLKIIDIYIKYNITLKLDIYNINWNLHHLYKIMNDKYLINNYILNINELRYLNTLESLSIHIDYNKFKSLKIINFINDRTLSDNNLCNLNNLEELLLPRNKKITDKGLINLNNLKILNLEYNKNITNKSLLNKLKLEKLTLVYNKKINDEGFVNITKLKELNLGYNNNRKLKLEFIINNSNLQTIILYKKKILSEEIINIINSKENSLLYQLNI
tara:strand:+ start:164 stop:877 length:714 start_codon:yes stop_codon:yes gene_type:complete